MDARAFEASVANSSAVFIVTYLCIHENGPRETA